MFLGGSGEVETLPGHLNLEADSSRDKFPLRKDVNTIKDSHALPLTLAFSCCFYKTFEVDSFWWNAVRLFSLVSEVNDFLKLINMNIL